MALTRLARIWSRLFGSLIVDVYATDETALYTSEHETVWAFHWRGVLHCWSLWYGGKHHPVWELSRYSFPLGSVAYWTKKRDR